MVYWAIGDKPPMAIEGFTLAGNTTRDKMSFVLPLDEGQPGTRVWVTACWLDRRLRAGKPGTPVSTRVGFGFLMAA